MRFLFGFVVGLGIGFVVVLLTTPKSGAELQGAARSKFDEMIAEGKKAAADRRAELEGRLADLQSGAQ